MYAVGGVGLEEKEGDSVPENVGLPPSSLSAFGFFPPGQEDRYYANKLQG